jgi:uncharacterized protein YbcI
LEASNLQRFIIGFPIIMISECQDGKLVAVGPGGSLEAGQMKTRGQLEAAISEAVVRFEREYMGRGPTETKAFIMDDIILIRLKGVLTTAEHQLAVGESDSGRALIKSVRRELVEKARSLLEMLIVEVTGVKVTSMHSDISTVTGESILVFTMDHNLLFENGRTK